MIDHNKSQLKRGFIDIFVLLTLYKKSQYAQEMIAILSENGIEMPEGTLYPLLNRLKNDGMLTYEWEESKSGPPRKYFFITDDGKNLIKTKLTSLQELYDSLRKLTSSNNITF